MEDVVDRILYTYQLIRPLDPNQISASRLKITRYIESLTSAGQSDAHRLSMVTFQLCTNRDISTWLQHAV
jgi:hypothetical protein